MSVYKVIDIIGTSPTSWEQAAAEAVQRARDSVDDIRVARVIEQDMAVDSAGKITYRIKLEVSFKMRPAQPRWHGPASRRKIARFAVDSCDFVSARRGLPGAAQVRVLRYPGVHRDSGGHAGVNASRRPELGDRHRDRRAGTGVVGNAGPFLAE